MTLTLRNSLEYAYREEEKPVMTVNDISKLTGVSIRTLQYYDTIGLLKPNGHTEAGYRLYDDTAAAADFTVQRIGIFPKRN